MFFNVWLSALVHPKKTILEWNPKAQNKGKETLGNIALSAFIFALLLIPLVGFGGFVMLTFIIVIFSVGAYFVASMLFYGLSKLFKGQGNLDDQCYNVSLIAAPIIVLTGLVSLLPLRPWLALVVLLYGLYLLTVSLKETHKYSTIKAVMTWLIPLLVASGILGALWMAMNSLSASSAANADQFERAVISSDAALCANISSHSNRDRCYWEIGKTMNDSSFCDRISDNDKALYCKAFLVNDPLLCEGIKDSERKKFCTAVLTNDFGLCYKIEEPMEISYCHARVERDPRDCGSIMFGDASIILRTAEADNCYYDLAVEMNDSSQCNEIKTDMLKNICLFKTKAT